MSPTSGATPAAPDDEALAWGMRNRILFVSEAIDVLTMVAMAEADKEASPCLPLARSFTDGP